MTKKVLQVHDFARALVAAGIIRKEDLNNISRIVIDADASKGVLEISITRVGDDLDKIAEAIITMERPES
jgi:hypothetical protein